MINDIINKNIKNKILDNKNKNMKMFDKYKNIKMFDKYKVDENYILSYLSCDRYIKVDNS